MTSFGWKRKITTPASKSEKLEKEFSEESTEVDPTFDWIAEAKRRKLVALEDNNIRYNRLKKEGSALAEEGRFWEAITRWNEALLINDKDAALLEMKAQALIQVHEWEPAIELAESAVKVDKTWWVGYQTLGRAQLGVGEVGGALRNFKVAFHLNPGDQEIWTEDILWAKHLLHQASLPVEIKEGEEEPRERIKPESLQVQIRTLDEDEQQ